MASTEELLIPAVVHMRAATFTCAAAGTVLLYDILITTPDEMKFIWPSQFSLPKCLYFVNRYFPAPCLILGMFYLAGFRGDISTELMGQQLSLITATWLLVIRVLALYGNKRPVVIGLYTLFIGTQVVATVLSITIIHSVWDLLEYFSPLKICYASPTKTLGIVYFTPVLCEIVLVVMQLLHAYRHTRQLGTLSRPASPLLRALYMDGFAYFVVVVTMRLWTALTFIFADPSYWYISPYLEFSLISISVSRLVLHLREVAENHRSLNLGSSVPLSNFNPTPDNNHGRGHPPDHSWDSRPSALPRKYSVLSLQYPTYSSYAYSSRIQEAGPFFAVT